MGTRKPDGYGFGQNLKPVMGMGFLMGIDIFHGYGFGTAKPSGFVPVAISNRHAAGGEAAAWVCGPCVAERGVRLCPISFFTLVLFRKHFTF